MRGMLNKKRGQVTIFIILAIVIVAAIVVFFTATKAGQIIINVVAGDDYDVQSSFESCIENKNEINEKVDLIMRHGGIYEPEFYYDYNSTDKLTYLCYTGNYYERCVMQSPMLATTMGQEIEDEIGDYIEDCFDDVVNELDRKGYDVDVGDFDFNVDLVPENIIIEIPVTLSATKEKERKSFEGLEIRKKSRAYELAMIAISILNFEARYGDSEVSNYMLHYPELKIVKNKKSDGTTLYFVSYRETSDKFYFASRSVVLPTGYTID